MRRWSLWTAVAATILTAMVVAGLALAGAGKDAAPKDGRGGVETIVLIDRETDDQAFTDVANDGPGPGDTITARDDLLDAKGVAKVGDAFINCVLQFGTPPVAQCDIVARLDGRGDIVLSGLAPETGDPFVLAVTGGTGEFRHVRGQALVESADEGPPATQRVTLELRGVR